MPADQGPVASRYRDRLTEADLRLLTSVHPGLSLTPGRVLALLTDDAVFEAVFAVVRRGRPDRPFLLASPFLTFAVAVHRTAADVQRSTYVPEWSGPRQRLPVFDGGVLAAFLAEPEQALFLTDLLASYAHVASGSYWTKTSRGWRRSRWSVLDPARLAGLLDVVPDTERSGVYRRLGDLALFLTGVFPDHTALHGVRQIEVPRLLAAAGAARDAEVATSFVDLLSRLGTRWYRRAVATAVLPTGDTQLLANIAERFDDARRALNVISDKYLFPHGNPWFSTPWSTPEAG
jgi:hypothetical protein